MDKVRILFVLSNECEDESQMSDIMREAFESCKQVVSNVEWIKEDQVNGIDLTKTDFVIFQDFQGKDFSKLQESKCARILGPWCVSVCLRDGRPIPNFPWPIYNVAMVDCIVACSHLPKNRKVEIKEKVQLMGGCYTDSLTSKNTHLITDTVKSEKYAQAAEHGSHLMLSEWVDEVWKESQNINIHADNPKFNKYRCLPFHNLTICSTGITSKEQRQELSSLVAKNGGIFTGNLNLGTTDVLIVHGNAGLTSEKYKAARVTPSIQCVSLDWINDSISKGYALPYNSYVVKNVMVSTPTKSIAVDPDFSMMSCISAPPLKTSAIEETVARISSPHKSTPVVQLNDIIDGLDVRKAKKAGPFLDGCSVYLAGFDSEQKEKLTKILNLSGATRYEEICDRLTHIIVGDPLSPDLKAAKNKNYLACLVSVRWLVQCIEKQRPVEEENYLINLHKTDKENINSPLTKTALSMLRFGRVSTEEEKANTQVDKNENPEADPDFIIQHYFNSQSKETDTLANILKEADNNFNSKTTNTYQPNATYSQTTNTNLSSQSDGIFDRLKFVLINFDNENYEYIQEQIETNGGSVLARTYSGIPDYVISEKFIITGIKHAANEVVNDLWVLESLQEGVLITDIKYYHRPHVIKDTNPLTDCVIVISSYTAFERIFLKNLITALGGIEQEQLARVTRPDKNILASTHLVSLEASGKKYAAALKWNLPVINKDWLLECARTGTMVSDENFLVGEAKSSGKIGNTNTTIKGETSNKTDTPKSGNIKNNNATKMNKEDTPNRSNKFEFSSKSVTSRNFDASTTLKENTPIKSTNMDPPDLEVTKETSIRQSIDVEEPHCSKNNISIPEITIKDDNSFVQPKIITPNRKYVDTPERCSQVTPVNKIMQQIRQNHKIGSAPNTPDVKTWFNVDTPETPLGAFIRPNPSPGLRKQIQRGLNYFPDYVSPKKRRSSTPLSELKRRLYNKLPSNDDPGMDIDDPNEGSVAPPQGDDFNDNVQNNDDRLQEPPCIEESHMRSASMNLYKQLEELENVVMTNNMPRRSRGFSTSDQIETASVAPSTNTKESQPFTVGWDYSEELKTERLAPAMRIFILSGIDNNSRKVLVTKLESLGATVSGLANYDPACTHLLSPKPVRNEKTLACMAAGKWILHISYVDKCVAAGTFLDEEEFEFGNPKSKGNIGNNFDSETLNRIQAMYWWRREIAKRGYGAFHDMRAMVVAVKKDPISRVIEAGGGVVINASPPFDNDDNQITHCLIEAKAVTDISIYVPLAQRGIYCVNTLYISEFLHRTCGNIIDCILPHYRHYYKKKTTS